MDTTKPSEIRCYRCCMCPQRDSDNRICPAGPGKPEETWCDFVVSWIDDDSGRKYRVMKDKTGSFRTMYQDSMHTGSRGWKKFRELKGKEDFDQAQEELNDFAMNYGWRQII